MPSSFSKALRSWRVHDDFTFYVKSSNYDFKQLKTCFVVKNGFRKPSFLKWPTHITKFFKKPRSFSQCKHIEPFCHLWLANFRPHKHWFLWYPVTPYYYVPPCKTKRNETKRNEMKWKPWCRQQRPRVCFQTTWSNEADPISNNGVSR